MSDATMMQDNRKPLPGGGRSVGYPFIPLEQAVARAKTLWDNEGKNAAYVSAAVKHWGYAEKSSGGRQTVAALKAFGLISDEGSGDGRQIRLTGRALDILLDPDAAHKRKALQESAIMPKIYSDLLSKWSPHELPSDPTITAYLLREKDFNRSTVEDFIKDFRANIDYTGLAESANKPLGEKTEDLQGVGGGRPNVVAIGSRVQWAPGGILQFVEPRKVSGISDSKEYVFVEGSFTGNPMSEVTVVQEPHTAELPLAGNQPPLKPAPAGAKQDTFTLDEGLVILQWPAPLSETSYEDFESWIQLQLKKIKRSVTA